MLWVHASGATWQKLPEEGFGPWQTIYGHYSRFLRASFVTKVCRSCNDRLK
jgi:transposase